MKLLYALETYVIRMDWFSRSAKGKNKIRVDGNIKRASQFYPISQAVTVQCIIPLPSDSLFNPRWELENETQNG